MKQPPPKAPLPQIATNESALESSSSRQDDCTQNAGGTRPRRPSFTPAQAETRRVKRRFAEKFESRPIKHDHVHVLLFSWAQEIDDLKVEPEVRKLEEVFKIEYGFQTCKRSIETKLDAYSILSDFAKKGAPDTLLIVYYAGHGYMDEEQNSLNIFARQRSSNMTTNEFNRNALAWSKAEHVLDEVEEADVLVIFDCCMAGSYRRIDRAPRESKFEFFAACADKQMAAVPGQFSFTTALIQSLRDLRRGNKPFTTQQLLHKIMDTKILLPDQTPQLIPRYGRYDDNVWISPLNAGTAMPEQYRLKADHEYLDVRLHFHKALMDDDLDRTAETLSDVVNWRLSNTNGFPVRNIVVQQKGSVIKDVAYHWKNYQRESTGETNDDIEHTESTVNGPMNVTSTPVELGSNNLLSPSPRSSLESRIPFAPSAPPVVESPESLKASTPLKKTYEEIRLDPYTRERVEQMLKKSVRHHSRMLVACLLDSFRNCFWRTTYRLGLVSEYLPSFKWTWRKMFSTNEKVVDSG